MKYNDDLSKRIDEGLKKAVADAVKRHKLLGESIAIWEDGKVVIVPADKIKLSSPKNIKNNSLEKKKKMS